VTVCRGGFSLEVPTPNNQDPLARSHQELGLASIIIWSRSDRREYRAIMCDQVQAWSRSFTLLVSVIC